MRVPRSGAWRVVASRGHSRRQNPGPYEDAVQNTPIFEENGPDKFKGIDIMRAVRSFDPCLPCGVHMYLGNGKVLETHHSLMFGQNV